MKFARRAKWLTDLFTPSVTPPVRFPDSYSHDVSLTQPYDGGGMGIIEPSEWSGFVNSAVGAAVTTTLLQLDQDLNTWGRILAVDLQLIAGVAPSCYLVISNFGGAIDVVSSAQVTPGTETPLRPIDSPIAPPGSTVSVRYTGGDAATQVGYRFMIAQVPLGTVFYI